MVAAPGVPLTHLSPLSGRTVLVTGHSGFIGSWLCSLLRVADATIVGFSLSDDAASLRRADWLAQCGVQDIRGDVRDLPSLLAVVRRHEPDVLIHLAAQPILRRGIAEPHFTFDVNINGSLTVLESVRVCRVPALVHVTSDKCYAPAGMDHGPMTEAAGLGGEGPYPASKTIAEVLFREFNALMSEHTSAASVRLGNVVGGGDEADRLVPNALRAFRVGKPFAVRDPNAVRPFQHALDVAWGLCHLAAALLSGRVPSGLPLNFAPPSTGSSTGALVAELARSWGDGAIVSDEPEVADFPEQQTILLDGAVASALLGWQHCLDLAGTASWTVEWAKMTGSGSEPAVATSRQVARFLERLKSGTAAIV